ncbi:MAG: hypothetical protein WEB19_02545 [Acidimicrobiia bacterium]
MRSSVGSVLALGVLLAGVSAVDLPAAGAGGRLEAPVEHGRLYQTKVEGLTLRLFSLTAQPAEGQSIQIQVRGKCEDLSVDEAFVAAVDADGRFDLRFRRTDDESRDRWRIRGTFRRGKATGRLDASLLESDNDSGDSKCDIEGAEWRATAGKPDAALDRLESVVVLPREDVAEVLGTTIAAGPDAIYVQVNADKPRVLRIDPTTSSVVWSRQVGTTLDDLAATADAVWVLGFGTLFRLDATTGEKQAEIDVSSTSYGSVATTDDGVWISGTDRAGSSTGLIQRVDPRTNQVVDSIPVEGFEPSELAVGPQGLYALGIRRPSDGGGSAGGGIARVDPKTAAIVASAEIDPDEDIAASDDGVFAIGLYDPVFRIDPLTLEVNGRTKREVFAMGTAPPGVWASTEESIVAFDAESLKPVVEVPVGSSDIAGGFGSVWLFDEERSVVIRVRAS